jgi:hypothetical protein
VRKVAEEKKAMSVRVDPEVIRRFKIACAIKDEKISDAIEKLMVGYADEVDWKE